MTEGFEGYVKGAVASALEATTSWDVTIDDQEALADIMKELLKSERNNKKVFAPMRVHTDCPYASQVEFGTGPAQHTSPKEDQNKRLNSMIKWVRARNLADSGKEQAKAEELIRVIIHNGIAPNPYFRSAVNTVMERNNADANFLNEGGYQQSILDLANEILDTIEENMATVPHVSESDPLAKSFKVEECTTQSIRNDGAVDVPIMSSGADTSITEDMWRNEEAGRNGKRPHHKR